MKNNKPQILYYPDKNSVDNYIPTGNPLLILVKSDNSEILVIPRYIDNTNVDNISALKKFNKSASDIANYYWASFSKSGAGFPFHIPLDYKKLIDNHQNIKNHIELLKKIIKSALKKINMPDIKIECLDNDVNVISKQLQTLEILKKHLPNYNEKIKEKFEFNKDFIDLKKRLSMQLYSEITKYISVNNQKSISNFLADFNIKINNILISNQINESQIKAINDLIFCYQEDIKNRYSPLLNEILENKQKIYVYNLFVEKIIEILKEKLNQLQKDKLQDKNYKNFDIDVNFFDKIFCESIIEIIPNYEPKVIQPEKNAPDAAQSGKNEAIIAQAQQGAEQLKENQSETPVKITDKLLIVIDNVEIKRNVISELDISIKEGENNISLKLSNNINCHKYLKRLICYLSECDGEIKLNEAYFDRKNPHQYSVSKYLDLLQRFFYAKKHKNKINIKKYYSNNVIQLQIINKSGKNIKSLNP